MANRLMCIDAGFAACGVVILELSGESWKPVRYECVRTEDNSAQDDYVAAADMARLDDAGDRLAALVKEYDVRWFAAEIPGGGGKSARAVRSMALASGLMSGLKSFLGLGGEYFYPWQTRKAAGVPSCITKRDKVKAIVVANMKESYPCFARWCEDHTKLDAGDVGDALATFEAAKSIGQMLGHITPLARR